MIRFVEKPHSVRDGVLIIEVWDDDRFLAAIYGGAGPHHVPPGTPALRIVSRHIAGIIPEGADSDGVAALDLIFTKRPTE